MPIATPDRRFELTSGTPWREESPGIFYTDDALVTADRAAIAALKRAALASPLRRARLCAHPAPDATQHDMLIASHRDTYVAPHRHLDKSETLLVIEGTAKVLLFDDKGRPSRAFIMAAADSGRPFFYRMPPRVFHSLLIDSEFLIFVESTKGPFRREDSENAPWAPGPQDEAGGRAFRQQLETAIAEGRLACAP